MCVNTIPETKVVLSNVCIQSKFFDLKIFFACCISGRDEVTSCTKYHVVSPEKFLDLSKYEVDPFVWVIPERPSKLWNYLPFVVTLLCVAAQRQAWEPGSLS